MAYGPKVFYSALAMGGGGVKASKTRQGSSQQKQTEEEGEGEEEEKEKKKSIYKVTWEVAEEGFQSQIVNPNACVLNDYQISLKVLAVEGRKYRLHNINRCSIHIGWRNKWFSKLISSKVKC